MGPVALAVQNPDIPVVEVDVRGAQRQGLSEPQTGAVNGESATAQGLTALAVDDTKCAENKRWTVQKRSHETAPGKVHKEHRRLRNGLDGGDRHGVKAYIGIKTGSFPLNRGPVDRPGPY